MPDNDHKHAHDDGERPSQAADGRKTRNVALAAIATFILVGGVAVAVVSSAGDGGSTPRAAAKPIPAKGLPEQLAANARNANRIIDGQISEQLDALKGMPVVVNQWASWCPSCKAEFGFFADVAKRYRGQVAFVGLDSEDKRSSAQDFLDGHPVPYPSIYDQNAEQAASIGGGQGWPTTVFYNADGQRTYLRPGGYVTVESLDNDIRAYALEDRS